MSDYDPTARQPKTLWELQVWLLYGLSKERPVVPQGDDPDWIRLRVWWRREFRQPLDHTVSSWLIDAVAAAGHTTCEAAREWTFKEAVAVLLDGKIPGKGKRRMSLEEANDKALELARKDPNFVHGSKREWEAGIGCGLTLIGNLPLWKQTMRISGRGKKDKSPAPQAVSFTEGMEATIGQDDQAEQLARLTEEQTANLEPSPLDPDPPDRPRRVRSHKRV
jgi:hypothetical protein